MEARSLFRGRGFLWWLLTVCRYKVSPPRLWNPRAPSGSSLEGSRNFNLVPGSSFPRVGQLSLPLTSNSTTLYPLLISCNDWYDSKNSPFFPPSIESIIRRINFNRSFVLISPTSVVSRIFVSQLLSDDLRTDRKVAGRGYKWCKLEPRQ